jgi:hypothetical protein
MKRHFSLLCIFLLLNLDYGFAGEKTVKIPVGTKVYCELTQHVVSKKSQFQEGDRIRVRVWRDVVVGGQTVIRKGAPVNAHISFLKTNKIAGIKGKIEIAATSCFTADDNEVALSGGYGREGKSYVGRTITLSALVLWPLIFIMGKKADLQAGTVFDAYTDEAKVVTLSTEDKRNIPKINLSGLFSSFDVLIDYETLTSTKKPKNLPIIIAHDIGKNVREVTIVRVNGMAIDPPLLAKISGTEKGEDDVTVHANVNIKKLFKHFVKGINRFDVKASFSDGSTESQEVIFDVQF